MKPIESSFRRYKVHQHIHVQLSLAIPPWVDAMSTNQMMVMLCGSRVKAGMVPVWLSGKTV